MNMKGLSLTINVIVLSLLTINCGSSPSNNAVVTTANTAQNTAANSNSQQTTKPAGSSPTGTLNTFYEGMKKRDDALVRSTFSKAALAEFEEELKKTKSATLVEFFESQSPTPEKIYDTRNEAVEGETATLEVRDPKRNMWIKSKYIKEDGTWKSVAPSELRKLNPELSEILDKEVEEKMKMASKDAKPTSNSNSKPPAPEKK